MIATSAGCACIMAIRESCAQSGSHARSSVTIGDRTVIAAGVVVIKSLPTNGIVAGVAANVINKIYF